MAVDKPIIEPGMSVNIEVRRMHQQISAYLHGSDLGVQALLEQAVREFTEGGGLQREVSQAVAEELPRLVKSTVVHALFQQDVRDAIANAITDALTRGFK